MANILGFEVPTPEINVTGFLSNSWIYIAIVGIIGLFIVIGIAVLLFFITYKKKIILFENISGAGYQPVLRTRARIVKLGVGGEEVLKTLAGGKYITAYGRKMGKNTYWFCKGQDGYWYNVVLGDLDTKMGMLDIEPIDRDVRAFHVALERLAQQNYGQTSKLPVILIGAGIFIALIILLVGMYVVAGRFTDASQALATTADTNAKVAGDLAQILQGSNNIASNIQTNGAGVVPAG